MEVYPHTLINETAICKGLHPCANTDTFKLGLHPFLILIYFSLSTSFQAGVIS